MSSPFTPIAEYAFLSDCHTGALIAPDGGVDWLCVPRFDAPSVLRQLAGSRGRHVPTRSVRHQRPERASLRTGHQRARNHLEDAVGMGDRSGRVDHGVRRSDRIPSRRTLGRPPTTMLVTCWCARPTVSTVVSRWNWCASPFSTTAGRRRVVAVGRYEPRRRWDGSAPHDPAPHRHGARCRGPPGACPSPAACG